MTDPDAPSFREALRTWTRVALQSFGGRTGQIAAMRSILVEEKRWISDERFPHALSYCMLLPGPDPRARHPTRVSLTHCSIRCARSTSRLPFGALHGGAILASFVFRVGVLPLIAGCAAVGVAWRLLGPAA